MKVSKNNFRFVASVIAFCLLGLTAVITRADVVYDTTAGGTQYIDQQTGNAYYYIGDTATIVPTSQALTTISIPFGTSYYSGTQTAGPAFTYTPNLTLDLYPSLADAETGTGLFGTAVENTVTLSNDGQLQAGSNFNYEDETLLTFDFTSQNIVLPATFAFAYHDAGSLDSNGSVTGENGLSVGLTTAFASPGISSQNYFDLYPNTPPTLLSPLILDPLGSNAGINVEAQINVVPEPASLSIAAIGAAALLRRRRRA